MVKIRVDYNKLYLYIATRQYQLESATIYKHPSFYEITVFILDGTRRIQQTFKQKKFDGVPNAVFSPARIIDENKNLCFASGSKESPTAINWYINYYVCKE